MGYRENLDQYEQQLISRDCNYTPIDGQIKSDPLLWTLNGGALARQCNDYQKSITYLDQAEAIFKQKETALALSAVGQSLGSILVNNNVNDYQGENYEKIMMNVYKGLNFMSLNDFDNARVEFNRALDRQRRAAEYFEQEINEAYKQYNHSEYAKEINTHSLTNSNIKNYRGDISPELLYPDFINPFATYISGLFFYLDHDYSKAEALFRQTARMLPNQKQVQDDLKLSTQSSKQKQNYVWLIYENGQGMLKSAFTYHFPSYLFTDKVITTDITVPTIYKRSLSYPYLKLEQQATTEIADMDNIVQQEFKKKLPAIMTEAMLNMIAKSTIQYTLEEKLEEYGGKFWGFLYQLSTDTADIRQWRAIPKNIQVARIPIQDNTVTIYKPDGTILTKIDYLQPNSNAIIYIKSEIVDHNTIHLIQQSSNTQ
ncbi:COG3014 family protein [Orbus mooreae]|uniref:COG3014 family protein n=1 Tax=Orbus mooreae TaxID=3074107 RepID=UPI00370D52F5